MINFLLIHPLKVIIFSIFLLISIITSYVKFGNGVEFFPEVEPDLSKIVIYARGNLSVEEKNNYVARVIGDMKHVLSKMDYEGKIDDSELAVDPKILISGIDEIKLMEGNLAKPHKLPG